MKKNCEYCGDDEEEVCEQCKEVIICQDCYCIIQPYDDDLYKIFVCSECAKQYPDQQTLRLG